MSKTENSAADPPDDPSRAPSKERVFVIRDFEIPEIKSTLDELSAYPPDGFVVQVVGLGAQSAQGHVFGDHVRPGIERAARALALVDQPNVNVGFEIGYALGKGKPVALALARDKIPEWLAHPPLTGFLAAPGSDIEKIEALLANPDWIVPPRAPVSGAGLVCLLPDTGGGKAYRRAVDRATADWTILPSTGWTLDDLPDKLDGAACVVWTLTQYPTGQDVRDGFENAAASIVAGFAFAHGIRLHIIREAALDRFIDLAHKVEPFEGIAGFDAKLVEIAERHAQGELPLVSDPVTAYRRYLRSVHSKLVPFFPQAGTAVLEQVYVELELDPRREAGLCAEHEGLDPATWRVAGGPRTLRDLFFPSTPPLDPAPRRWVVLGEAGAGKSTLMRHLAWKLADEEGAPVPVFVSLARCAIDGLHPFELAESELRKAVGDVAGAGLEVELRKLAAGRHGVCLLLDGLDEVAPDLIDRVRERLHGLSEALPNVAVCVTSRPVGHQDLGSPFGTARVSPLSQRSRRALLAKWLGTSLAAETWLRLETRPSLHALSGNPLMLTLVASLALQARDDARGGDWSLPTGPVRLYERAVELLLGRGFGMVPKSVKDRLSARRVLQALALRLQDDKRESWTQQVLDDLLWELRTADPTLAGRLDKSWDTHEDFLDDVATQSNLLGPLDGPSEPWRFLHRSLREFLAAEALVRRGAGKAIDFVGGIRPEDLPRWAETYSLFCGLVKEEARLPVLEALREKSDQLALRALPNVEGLDPAETLRFLVGTEGWDTKVLRGLLEGWALADDKAKDDAERLLLGLVSRELSVEELAYVHHTLEWLGRKPDRETFFHAADRWPADGFPDLEWVAVPAGTFEMGSPAGERERLDREGPVHPVAVDALRLAATAITNAQYEVFDKGHVRGRLKGVSESELADHPVVNVSWWEARLFCCWIGARLPSEAEWEYACRAGTKTPFHTGADLTTDQANYDGDFPYAGASTGVDRRRTVSARSFDPNDFGLFQMHGNVFEWCDDTWHDSYEGAPDDGSAWIDSASVIRVVRGGGWDYSARLARSAYRDRSGPGYRWYALGFRPARSVTAD